MAKKNRFQAFMLIFMLFAVYIFIFSESGLLERTRLAGRFEVLHSNINALKHKNSELYGTYRNYMRGEYTSEDYLKSGYIPSEGTLLYFRKGRSEPLRNLPEERGLFNVNLDHLRVIWIIISIMAFVYYYTRKNNGENFSDE